MLGLDPSWLLARASSLRVYSLVGQSSTRRSRGSLSWLFTFVFFVFVSFCGYKLSDKIICGGGLSYFTVFIEVD